MLPTLLIIGVPGNFNSWGERSTSEYLLLKRSFGTYTRIVSATGSRHFQELEIILGLFCFVLLLSTLLNPLVLFLGVVGFYGFCLNDH